VTVAVVEEEVEEEVGLRVYENSEPALNTAQFAATV